VEEPDGFGIVSDGAGDSAEIGVDEGQTAVTAIVVQGAAGEVTYEIAGGYDAGYFTIDSKTGALSFVDAPDFEGNGYYSNHSNSYHVIVRASDGVSSDEQELYVGVKDVDEAPVFRSYSGEPLVWEWAFENGTAAAWVGAEDPDYHSMLSYRIEGGADGHLFQVDPNTGELSFKAAPDYEKPSDSDGDNVYEVTVGAYSGALSATQSFMFQVEDQFERVVITSDGGQRDARLKVAENSETVTFVQASGDGFITYEIMPSRDSNLFDIHPFTGELRFRSRPDFEMPADLNGDNVYDLRVRATNGATYVDQRLLVEVENVNEAVKIIRPEKSVALMENRTSVTVMKATDPEGAAVSFAISGGADASLFRIDPATGTLSLVAALDFEAPGDSNGDNMYEVQVSASDGATTDHMLLSLRLINQNEAVVFVSGGGGDRAAVTIRENEGNVLTLLATDPDGTTPQYSIAGGADSALFELDPVTRELRFKSLPDFDSPADSNGDNVYEVIVKASDGSYSDFQTVSVTIANVYEGVSFAAPTRGLSVKEETAAIGAVSAVRESGSAFVYSISGGADASLFAIDSVTGTLSWVALPDRERPSDFNGDNVYDIVVSATDGTQTASQVVSVTVEDVFEPVEITSYGGAATVALTMTEGYYITGVTVTAVDEEGFGTSDPVVFTITGGADAALFMFGPNPGELIFTYEGTPDFEAPGDADGDNVYDVVVTASTSRSSDSQTFAITVTNRNEGIFITSDGGDIGASVSVNEGDRHVTTVVAEDPDGIAPTYSIVGGLDSAAFSIDPTTGVLSFIDSPDFEPPMNGGAKTSYEVIVSASDGEFTSRQTIQVGIKNVNESVAFTYGGGGDTAAMTVGENTGKLGIVTARDVDGDSLTYSIAGGADAALFDIEPGSGSLRFRQRPDFEAPGDSGGNNVYEVVLTVTDGAFSDSLTLSVTVQDLDESVSITSNGGGAEAAVTVAENGTSVAIVSGSDPDGRTVSYAIAGGADSARFTIDAATGALAFVAAPNFEAPADFGGNNVYDVIVSASDGTSTDLQALAVSVGNVKEAVAITSNGGGDGAAVAVAENGTAVATVAARDPDGGAVSNAIAGGADAARFTIDPTTGALAFVAAPNFEAPADSGANNVYDVIVSASDGSFTDSQALAISVVNVNEALAITSNGGGSTAMLSVGENNRAVATIIAADPDGTAATYSIVGGADSARFTINPQTGLLQFVSAPDFELPADSNGDNVYSVVVRAGDGQYWDDQALNVIVSNARDGNNVTGTSGGDSISSTSTNPALRTSSAEDVVYGRDGHDNIQGMAGDDDLYGEGGNDVLIGGTGGDRLTGGLGKDQFTYNSLSESMGTARDLIMDFSRSQGDKISLSAIDANSGLSNNQSFTFIGSAAFSNVAGQLRFETSGGITTISGDVNGDGIADLQIQLAGTVPLVASDFIL
jgi:Ca2+-binding RTX toxin-like protein